MSDNIIEADITAKRDQPTAPTTPTYYRPRQTFTQKLLRFTFELAGSSKPLILDGLRSQVVVAQGGALYLGGCEITIYGMTLSQTNQLSTIGELVTAVRRNTVTVEAGDEKNGMAVVYQGTIINGWADYAAMPNNAFRISANMTAITRLQAIPPTTISGAGDVATIMSGLAQQGNYRFENSGVQATLYDPYLPGTILDQINRVAKHADINYTIDPITNTLAIWPKNSVRNGQKIVVSPDNGMIGFPTYVSQGVAITSLFNPSITYGQVVSVQRSVVEAANKDWRVVSLVHELDSLVPNGNWRTQFTGAPPNLVVVTR